MKVQRLHSMSMFNSFQKVAKKNRKTFLTVACFVIIVSVELAVSFIKKEAEVIDDLGNVSDRNRVRIVKMEKDISRHSLQLQTVVTRLSFNDYIRHTDDRFMVQNGTDAKLLENIGVIRGRVSGLEKIIYALNMYELRASGRDCKNNEER